MTDRTEIPMQLNADIRGVDDFAFTLTLPAAPREGEHVRIGGRRFKVMTVDWHAFDPFPVRLTAIEIFT